MPETSPPGRDADQMPVRDTVRRLATWGPLPAEDGGFWTDERLEDLEQSIDAISRPITAVERDELLPLLDRLGDDDVHGLVWTVLHLIESSPLDGWPLRLPLDNRPWFELIRMRYLNLGDP